MPRKPTPKISAWSYSRWTTYDPEVGGCPRKARYKFCDRLPEPEGPALVRGREIHDLAEAYVRGTIPADPMPEALELFDEEFAALRANADDVLTEDQWAFTKDLQPCEWFGGRQTWLRIKVDVTEMLDGGRLRVIDHKTGKHRVGTYGYQLELYALGGFHWFEGVEEIETEMWFLDHGKIENKSFTAADAPKLEKLWRARAAPMLTDRVFATNPGSGCRWCGFSSKRGGVCEF